MTYLNILLFLLLSQPPTPTYCDYVPRELLQGPRGEFDGHYTNEPYGYSVVIPSGLTGYSAPEGYPQHGFVLLLGNPPQSSILVQGEANSLDYHEPGTRRERRCNICARTA